MRFSTFRERYPVPLSELLVAPVLFRDAFPFLLGTPPVSAPLLRDLARAAGHSETAIRTAMSRLRASGLVEVRVPPDGGEPRYHRGALTRSLQEIVAGQLERPDGFTLVVFAFATENTRERQVVREALRLHGFQRLAQNTYIGGCIDTTALESTFRHEGIEDNVFVFRTRGDLPPNVEERLITLFDLRARARVLRALRSDLTALLEDPRLDDAEHTQRLLYAGPVHYRITFVEEPQLPESAHPAEYPLADVVTLLPRLAEARAQACVRYFSSFERSLEGPRPRTKDSS
jgi:DNA-binding transcriptional regulator PaaX